MNPSDSVFLDFNLPNATTWFYFSWLLAIALFFKFSRVLSMRNWDVVTLFLLVPGLLVIQAASTTILPVAQQPATHIASLIGQGAGGASSATGGLGAFARTAQPTLSSARWLWWGYFWLLCGTAYFLVRCFLDLTLIKRPALAPNLSFGGLAWFAGALMVCLIAVAFRTSEPVLAEPVRNPIPTAIDTKATPTIAPTNSPVGQETPQFQWARKQFGTWLERAFAVLGHIAVVIGLVLIGWRHFQDPAAGMAAATFYLMLPYTGLFVGQSHHVWPTALMVWALVSYRVPLLAGALLGLAAGTMYFPLVLAPLWFGFYWKRGAFRFLASLLIVGSLGLAVLWLKGDLEAGAREALRQSAWQSWKVPTTEGFWTGVPWAYRIPIFLGYSAMLVITAIWPWPKNLAQVIALSAALLIGIQFWYADQGGVYVLWYLPLLLLLTFRPNLDERRAPVIVAESDWLTRAGHAMGRLFSRIVKGPEKAPASR
ncbi:MAG: hypothetical protein HY040_05490 [Planctomycetes bacterium]|nr:hypothetical protein [Planctomycetota bacterium]